MKNETINEVNDSNLDKYFIRIEDFKTDTCSFSNFEIKKDKYYGYNIPVYSSKYLQYGDYDNSCMVERSNVEFMKEYCKDNNIRYIFVTGAYDSTAIAFPLISLLRNPEFVEMLFGLDSYCVFDDELMSNMEYEAINEAIDTFLIDDVLEKINPDKPCIDDYSNSEKIINLVENCINNNIGDYAFIEAGGIVYIDIDKTANELKDNPLFNIA